MSLIDRAASDLQSILTNNNEFGTVITFVTPNGSKTVMVNGLAFKHWMKVNDFGEIVNTKVATIQISEDSLISFITDSLGNIITDANGNRVISPNSYPTRNSNNRIDLLNHRVSWSDHEGVWNYVITETQPDESFGTILCKLNDKV